MNLSKFALAGALACGVFGSAASAVELRQPASVQKASFTNSYFNQGDSQPSPSDLPVQPSPSDLPAMPEPPTGLPFSDACGCDFASGCNDCVPWRLFDQDNCTGWHVYGFANGGIFTNTRNTASRYNGPVTFADRRDGQFNQLYGVVEKNTYTGGCGWDFGGRFDVLYGTDWVYNTQVGWEASPTGALLDGWNSSPYYGLVTPQAYGEIAYNDLSVKVGRFYSPIGYEVVPATGNFFATHAYAFQYGKPLSHSGALATWRPSDNWTFLGGLVNGWDRFDGVSDRVAALGGAIYRPDHGAYTIALTGISGTEPGFNSGLQTTRSMYSLVFNWFINDNWNYVFQHDNGWQQDSLAGGANAEWYGINQYLFYRINNCWKAGLRAEWFRDDDGARVAGIRPGNLATGDAGNATTGPLVGATPGGYAGNFYEISLGLNWTPHTNLIVRPEVRYDWFDGIGTPFGDNTASSQWVYGLDAIVLW